jgi:hypothetical protein
MNLTYISGERDENSVSNLLTNLSTGTKLPSVQFFAESKRKVSEVGGKGMTLNYKGIRPVEIMRSPIAVIGNVLPYMKFKNVYFKRILTN